MVRVTLSVVIASDGAILFAGSSPGCAVGIAAPLDVADFLDQISTDPVAAAARLTALTPDQRYRQAIAHAAWCDAYDVPVAVDVVAAAYERFIDTHWPLHADASGTA